MRKKIRTFKAGGRRWKLRFVPLKKNLGDVDLKIQEVRIDSGLSGEIELDTIIHEALHCCYLNIDEEYIEEGARDIARLLWRLGYRKGDR